MKNNLENTPQTQIATNESLSDLSGELCGKSYDKEFAKKVIALYCKYGNKLNKTGLQKHNKILEMFQNLRDKNILSA